MKKPKSIFKSLTPFLAFVISPIFGTAQVTLTSDHENAVYEVGESITWTINVENVENYDSLRYEIKPGALDVFESGPINLKDGEFEIAYEFKEPGSVIIDVRWGSPGGWGKNIVGGGICAPEQIELSSERPADFNSFWDAKIAELQKTPINSVITEEASNAFGVTYAKVQMDNIRDSHIQAQMAQPAQGDKFPALLVVQWAGVYPLDKNWVTGRAREGWLVLNINPHDLPIDEERKYYEDKVQNYWAKGNDDRDNSYFLRMYLSCYRGVEFLKKHPNWNGKVLAVTGDSQGGQQTLMTAGLHPDVTHAMALVPAGFDMLGPQNGRKGGWPQWYSKTNEKDAKKVHEASRYYDVANFVQDIKCPILVGVGVLDETCPAEGIIAGLNQLSSNKEVILLPNSQHQERGTGSQVPYKIRRDNGWLAKIKDGKSIDDYSSTLKRMFKLAGTEETFKTAVTQMFSMFKQQNTGNIDGDLFDEMEDEFKSTSMDDLLNMLTPIYKKHLTISDLESTIEFYETPVGKKYAAKTPLIAQESMIIGQSWGAEIGRKFMEKLEKLKKE